MPIRILPPEVANKIAAGEVIERPASVAKELLENAIDAGADEIRVEIAQGGRRLIRVTDNGSGIPAEQVELAFARHATSKLASAEDLYRIVTLGFRGEALASIAAVSRVSISTRVEDEPVGTRVYIEGGSIVRREPTARARGTTVQVENLFYNTPARLKFLRADTTEAGHIARLVHSYSLAYPEKRLELQTNDRLVIRTPGTGALLDTVVTLYGLDIAEQLLELPRAGGPEGPGEVWGYVSVPALHRSNRQDIILLVNRRWIQDNALSYAIEQAYHTLLPAGRHPLAILSLTVPPEEVDVNIHPTKREVRFRRGHDLFSLVQKSVRTLLMAQRPVPLASSPFGREEGPHGTPFTDVRHPALEQTRLALEAQRTGDVRPLDWSRPPSSSGPAAAERLPMLRVVGQVAQTYIIAEGPGGMYLIDQHAAHERIRFEELQAQQASMSPISQELLEPLPIELSAQQCTLLEPHLDLLASLGLEMIPFGGNTILVKRIPTLMLEQDIAAAIGEMVDRAMQGGEGFTWEEQALITLSCHTAVRAGQTLSPEEMRDLVRQLERTALPHTCPHGRPTMIHLTRAQLEREFGRR